MTAKLGDSPEVSAVRPGTSKQPGIVLHSPRAYDLMARIFFLGREGSVRRRLLSLVGPRCGENVLDVGCGTGSLVILVKKQVGPTGRVVGVDASEQMIGRARRKAERAGVEVDFRTAPAQALPFSAPQFDIVLSTLMLHHLPRPARLELAREARRVLQPGGRLLVVDFEKSVAGKARWRAMRHRHGSIKPGEIAQCLADAGLDVVASGPVGCYDMAFAVGTVPALEQPRG